MKKKFLKRLALALALTVAVNTVNVPAAAAAKPGFMSSKAVVKVGQTKKYRTKNNSKYSVKFVIGNKKVATIKYSKARKFAKVTGVKPGKTTLRADFKNYTTKKVTKVRIPVYVKAAGTATAETITVSTQAQLEEALKSGKYEKIVIKTDAGIELNVPVGDYKNVDLVVDAPNASITNKGQFREITLNGTAVNYTENGKDNVIYVMADEADFKVAENTDVEKVVFKGRNANVQMGTGSRMRSVVNETGENIAVKTPGGVETVPAGTEDKTIEAGTVAPESGNSSGSTGGGSGSGNINAVDVTGIVPNDDLLQIEDKGKTIPLSVSLVPANASQKIEWNSDNPYAATVDANGNVTITGQGMAVITATVTAKDGTVYTCKYEVFGKQDAPSSTMTSTGSSITLSAVGETGKLTVKDVPEGDSITWFSDAKNVVIVDANGNVTATGAGTATITGITEDGEYRSWTVKVEDVPKFEKEAANAVPEGESDKHTYYKVMDKEGNRITSLTGSSISVTYKENGVDKDFSGEYSKFVEHVGGDKDTVNDDYLMLPHGWTDVEAVIQKDGASYKVATLKEVTEQSVIDIAAAIRGDSVVPGGDMRELTAEVSNSTGKDSVQNALLTYVWTSSDPSIVKVEGKTGNTAYLTGVSAGETTITLTVEGRAGSNIGKATAEFKVTVTDRYEVIIASRENDYTVGDIVTLGATVKKNGNLLSGVSYEWKHLYNSTTYTVDFTSGTKQRTIAVRVLESPISYVRLVVTGDEIDLGNGVNTIEQRFVLNPKPIKNPAPIRIKKIKPDDINNMQSGFNINQELIRLEEDSLEDGWKSDTIKDGVITAKIMYKASEGNKIVSYSPYPNMDSKMYFALDVITLGQVTGEIKFRNKANPEKWMSVEEAKEKHLLDAFGGQDDFVYWCGVVPNANDWFEIKIGDGNPLHVNMIPWKVQ